MWLHNLSDLSLEIEVLFQMYKRKNFTFGFYGAMFEQKTM